ncbi:MAG: glycosyltransferase family 39 protein, partial [Chloroflexi bacterium]|nr:glycosyltransferase family 39 protein [Chloroflexota bacterium]
MSPARAPWDRPLVWAGLILAINLIWGLAFCFLIFPHLADVTTGLDPDGYGSAGRILYEQGQFQSISKAPLYPAFVALVSLLAGGYQATAIQAAQCVLSALTCVVLYALFRRTLGDRPAIWAGLACAVYPMSVWYTPRLFTEVWLTLVLAAFCLTLVWLLQRPGVARAVLAGVLAGVLALSKGIALAFVPLALAVLLLRERRAALVPALAFALAALALVAPWTWRNWQLTGRLLPIHTTGGFNLYLGNGFTRHWPQAPLSYADLKTLTLTDRDALYAAQRRQPADELEQDDVLMAAALAELLADPALIGRKLVIQSLTFWYLAADRSKSLLTGALQIPVALLALPGLVRALRHWRDSWAWCLLIPIAGIAGVSVPVFAFGRLAAPIMPYLLGLAVYGWWPAFQAAHSIVKEAHMTDPQLSPRVAAELARILDTDIPATPRARWMSQYSLKVDALICLECGHVNPNDVVECAQCGEPLSLPCGPDGSAYLTATDLLRAGELSPAQVRDLLGKIAQGYSFYTAGTRYAVFGGHR